ncbi:MAG: hypothetical protein GTO14_04360 [Anaerolineales bacterium]|nr:hypothetical protein [Anaerolineales bacterium]
MPLEDGWVIVCGILALVVLINIGIALPFLRSQGSLFRNMGRGFKFGHQEESEKLAELRRLVEALGETTELEETVDED